MTIHEQIVRDMRDALADCVWADIATEDFDDMSDAEIIAGIRRHYPGGLRPFICDGRYFERRCP